MTNTVTPAMSPNAEATLLALCASLAASRAEIEFINRTGVPEDMCSRAMDRWSATIQKIVDTQARTPKSTRAKAGAVRDVMKIYLLDGPGRTMMNSPGVYEEDRIAWSLVHDILGEEPYWGEAEVTAQSVDECGQ